MSSKKSQIVAFIAFIYIAVASCVLVFVLFKIAASGGMLSERVNAIADRNARSRMYQELSKTVDNTESVRTILEGYLLTEDQTSDFLTNIESLGNTVGVKVTTDSLKVVRQDKSFIDLLVIEFSVNGDEASVEHMLKLLEALPYNSQVSAFSSTRSPDGSTSGNIELTVSLLKHA